jgi:hypothetical protein
MAIHGQIDIMYTYATDKLPYRRYAIKNIATNAPMRAEFETNAAIRGHGMIRMIDKTPDKKGSSDANDRISMKF